MATSFEEAKKLVIAGLLREIASHQEDDLEQIGADYEKCELAMIGRDPNDSRFDSLGHAFSFWDEWCDARNHTWEHYAPRTKDDWPREAQKIIDYLETDADLNNPLSQRHFPESHPRESREVSRWNWKSFFRVVFYIVISPLLLGVLIILSPILIWYLGKSTKALDPDSYNERPPEMFSEVGVEGQREDRSTSAARYTAVCERKRPPTSFMIRKFLSKSEFFNSFYGTYKITLDHGRFLVWLKQNGPIREIKNEASWTIFGPRRYLLFSTEQGSARIPESMIWRLCRNGLIGREWPMLTPYGHQNAPPRK